MKYLAMIVSCLVAWTVAFIVYGYYELLLIRLRYLQAEFYFPPEVILPLVLGAGLLTAIPGFMFISPLVWQKRKEGLAFNHVAFWTLAAPALLLMLLAYGAWSGPLRAVVGLINKCSLLQPVWHFLVATPGPSWLPGTMIGIAFGLALIVKRGVAAADRAEQQASNAEQSDPTNT